MIYWPEKYDVIQMKAQIISDRLKKSCFRFGLEKLEKLYFQEMISNFLTEISVIFLWKVMTDILLESAFL